MKRKLKKTCLILLCLMLTLTACSVVHAANNTKNGWVVNAKGKQRYYVNGKYVTGRVVIKNKTYYFKPNGYLYLNCFVKDGSSRYHTNQKGIIYTNTLKKYNGKYYYFSADGKAALGWQTIGAYKYYFQNNFTASAGGSVKIADQYYIFFANGRLASGSSTRILTINNIRYYVTSAGTPAPGWHEINDSLIYVYTSGRLAVNTTIDGIELDASGYGHKNTNAYKDYATELANEFIAAHGGTGDNVSKLRNCFNYILAYENFTASHVPTGFPTDPNWVYMEAISMFTNSLKGNCLGFSASVAACASALGFNTPTIIYYTEDHSVVVIDGKYYDNMGGGIFAGNAPYNTAGSEIYGTYTY